MEKYIRVSIPYRQPVDIVSVIYEVEKRNPNYEFQQVVTGTNFGKMFYEYVIMKLKKNWERIEKLKKLDEVSEQTNSEIKTT